MESTTWTIDDLFTRLRRPMGCAPPCLPLTANPCATYFFRVSVFSTENSTVFQWWFWKNVENSRKFQKQTVEFFSKTVEKSMMCNPSMSWTCEFQFSWWLSFRALIWRCSTQKHHTRSSGEEGAQSTSFRLAKVTVPNQSMALRTISFGISSTVGIF